MHYFWDIHSVPAVSRPHGQKWATLVAAEGFFFGSDTNCTSDKTIVARNGNCTSFNGPELIFFPLKRKRFLPSSRIRM